MSQYVTHAITAIGSERDIESWSNRMRIFHDYSAEPKLLIRTRLVGKNYQHDEIGHMGHPKVIKNHANLIVIKTVEKLGWPFVLKEILEYWLENFNSIYFKSVERSNFEISEQRVQAVLQAANNKVQPPKLTETWDERVLFDSSDGGWSNDRPIIHCSTQY